MSATTFTVTTAIWLIVTQWISAGLGGYIAGRLRTRWHGTPAHEVFFRDTAHGLITWSVATVLVGAVFAGSLSALLSGGVACCFGGGFRKRGRDRAERNLEQLLGRAERNLEQLLGESPRACALSAGPLPMTYAIHKLFRPAMQERQ